MLARAGTAKKSASKFQDSESSHMSRPRTMSDPPRRPATRVPPPRPKAAAAAAVGSEASGARHRALGAGRGTAPRSPLHEKKPAGAGSRVAELGKAHGQLTEMREQLAAAEKARKDARAAFVEARKRPAKETERALRESALREIRLVERLAASERAREALEAEARRSRVQNEQWRKAAEEAAAVLGGSGHHVGKLDDKDMRHHCSVGGSGRKIDNEGADGEGSGEKWKSGGVVRLLADLWKKKAPK